MRAGTLGRLMILASGAVALVGSLLPFYRFDSGARLTVWQRGLFPTATLIAIVCILASLEIVVSILTGRQLPSPALSFTWEQINLAIGCFATVVTLAYLLQYRAGGRLGTGYFMLLGASLGTLTGAILSERARLLGRAPTRDAAEGLALVDVEPSPDPEEGEADVEGAVPPEGGVEVPAVGEPGRSEEEPTPEEPKTKEDQDKEAEEKEEEREPEEQPSSKPAPERAASRPTKTKRSRALKRPARSRAQRLDKSTGESADAAEPKVTPPEG
jgi:hypothetical protein